MTRVAKLAYGTLLLAGVGIVAVCNGQTASSPPPKQYRTDPSVGLEMTKGKLDVRPMIALVSIADQKAHPFQWNIGELPAGYTIEIDIHVQGTTKGPFSDGDAKPKGRYTAVKEKTSLRAGAITSTDREVWKYDVILRDASGNDIDAKDPMIVIME